MKTQLILGAILIPLIAMVIFHMLHIGFYDNVEGVVLWHQSQLQNNSFASFYQSSWALNSPPLYGFIGYWINDSFRLFSDSVVNSRFIVSLSQFSVLAYLFYYCRRHNQSTLLILFWVFFLPVVHLGWTLRFDNIALFFTLLAFHFFNLHYSSTLIWMERLYLTLSGFFIVLSLQTKFTVGVSLLAAILIVLVKEKKKTKFMIFTLFTLFFVSTSLFFFQKLSGGYYLESLLTNNNPFSFKHFTDRTIWLLIGSPIVLIVLYLKKLSFFELTWWVISGLVAFITVFKVGSNLNYFMEFGLVSLLVFIKKNREVKLSAPFLKFAVCFLLFNFVIVCLFIKDNYQLLTENKKQVLLVNLTVPLSDTCIKTNHVIYSSLLIFSERKPCTPDPHIAKFLKK